MKSWIWVLGICSFFLYFFMFFSSEVSSFWISMCYECYISSLIVAILSNLKMNFVFKLSQKSWIKKMVFFCPIFSFFLIRNFMFSLSMCCDCYVSSFIAATLSNLKINFSLNSEIFDLVFFFVFTPFYQWQFSRQEWI